MAGAVGVETSGAVDESSERWVTAVHEAAHAEVAEALGYRVQFCRVDTDETGMTRHGAEGVAHAVVAVAGERATRLICGAGGGSSVDYHQAGELLAGTGRDIEWAEDAADNVIDALRRDITALARRLYRYGHR